MVTPLGRQLLAKGRIDHRQLVAARRRQRQLGGRLGTCLLELGAIGEEQLLEALTDQLDLPTARLEDLDRVPEAVHSLLPANLAISWEVVPFRVDGSCVHVAMPESTSPGLNDELATVMGRPVRQHVAIEARIFDALDRYYGKACSPRYRQLLTCLDHNRGTPVEALRATAEATTNGPRRRGGIVYPPSPLERRTIQLTSEELAALRSGSADEAPAAAADGPPAEAPPTAESHRALGHGPAAESLREAASATEIGRSLLSELAREFQRAVLFRVNRDRVRGWLGVGSDVDRRRLTGFETRLDRSSVFGTLATGGSLYVGALPPAPDRAPLLGIWRGNTATECLLAALAIEGRTVAILYADRGREGVAAIDLRAIQGLAADAATAFHRLIVERRRPAR